MKACTSRQPEPQTTTFPLPLMLAALRFFGHHGDTQKRLTTAAQTVAQALEMLTNETALSSARDFLCQAAIDAEHQTRAGIDQSIEQAAPAAAFQITDTINDLVCAVSDNTLWLGFLAGWTLHEQLQKGGAR